MSTHERQKVCPQVILTGSLSRCSQRRHLSRGFSCLSLSRSLSQSSIPTIFKMVFPPSLVFLHVEIHKLSEQARQGRKTADWLEKIPLRACSNALRWPYADAVGSKEWAIRRSYNRAIMNVRYLAEIWRALCWNTSLKGLVYNGIILFCFALEVIFVIVLR